MNVVKGKVMRCSRYGLKGESLELDADWFKYLQQVAAGGGCERDVVHRMTEWYRGWGALKSVLLH